jgi:tetratricopeptide (TPR) repeat protein
LANTSYAAGRFGEAADQFLAILEVRTRVLGAEHPDTLRSQSSLANSYLALGFYDEAIKLHQQTIENRERVLGPDHPRTDLSRTRLESARRAAAAAGVALASGNHEIDS